MDDQRLELNGSVRPERPFSLKSLVKRAAKDHGDLTAIVLLQTFLPDLSDAVSYYAPQAFGVLQETVSIYLKARDRHCYSRKDSLIMAFTGGALRGLRNHLGYMMAGDGLPQQGIEWVVGLGIPEAMRLLNKHTMRPRPYSY
ncbi:hypothetical protein JXB02_05595 [Candidatus Woesearchaeota archaeon]|nr:hypothetical protein [Candidatus Woesearchaeota archaeon]